MYLIFHPPNISSEAMCAIKSRLASQSLPILFWFAFTTDTVILMSFIGLPSTTLPFHLSVLGDSGVDILSLLPHRVGSLGFVLMLLWSNPVSYLKSSSCPMFCVQYHPSHWKICSLWVKGFLNLYLILSPSWPHSFFVCAFHLSVWTYICLQYFIQLDFQQFLLSYCVLNCENSCLC